MPVDTPGGRVSPGVAAIQRARGFLGRTVGAVRDAGADMVGGIRNAIPGTANHDWRQTIDTVTNGIIPGNWFDSQTRRWQNPITGRDFGTPRTPNGVPLAPGQVPRADAGGSPTPPPAGVPALPNYEDPNAVGPPASMAGPTPMPRAPATPAGPVGAQRGNRTIATGQAAQNFARGIGQAHSGLGASSFGRDQLNSTRREA